MWNSCFHESKLLEHQYFKCMFFCPQEHFHSVPLVGFSLPLNQGLPYHLQHALDTFFFFPFSDTTFPWVLKFLKELFTSTVSTSTPPTHASVFCHLTLPLSTPLKLLHVFLSGPGIASSRGCTSFSRWLTSLQHENTVTPYLTPSPSLTSMTENSPGSASSDPIIDSSSYPWL